MKRVYFSERIMLSMFGASIFPDKDVARILKCQKDVKSQQQARKRDKSAQRILKSKMNSAYENINSHEGKMGSKVVSAIWCALVLYRFYYV